MRKEEFNAKLSGDWCHAHEQHVDKCKTNEERYCAMAARRLLAEHEAEDSYIEQLIQQLEATNG